MRRLLPPSAWRRQPRPSAPAGDRRGPSSCSSRAAGPAYRRAARAALADQRSGEASDTGPGREGRRGGPVARPSRRLGWHLDEGVLSAVRGAVGTGWDRALLAQPELRRGIPEVRFVEVVDERV